MSDWLVYIMAGFGCACIVMYMVFGWLDWWPQYKQARHLQRVIKRAEEEQHEQDH